MGNGASATGGRLGSGETLGTGLPCLEADAVVAADARGELDPLGDFPAEPQEHRTATAANRARAFMSEERRRGNLRYR